MPQDRKRILIIGAGPGGLTAGMILAYRGFDVVILERKDRVGGRNGCFQLGPYRFDIGPTFLMMRPILDECFQEAGTQSTKLLEFIPLDPMYRLHFADNVILHPSRDFQKYKNEIRHFFPGLEYRLDLFLKQEEKRFQRFLPCLQRPYSSLGSLLTPSFLKVLPYLSLSQTVFDVLQGYFENEQLSLAFSFQSKYLGMSPWECPGAFAMLPYIEYAYGIEHVIGGLSEISKKMAEVALQNGARIHLNTEVARLILKGKTVTGVQTTTGEEFFADEVVINADFADAMTRLVPPGILSRYSPQQLRKKRFSCSTFMLYLGLDCQYDLPHHTIYFSHDYRRYVDSIFHGSEMNEDLSFYVRNASRIDPTLAPPHHSAIYILVPVPNLRTKIDWDQEVYRLKDRVLQLWIDRTGFKDLRSHIVIEKILTPRDWQTDFYVYEGATFNLAHTLSQMLYFRPHNQFEELEHCYLVGGGTHPGSGLPTIYESGQIVANMISRYYGVPFQSLNTFT